jgi:hypothetical protein
MKQFLMIVIGVILAILQISGVFVTFHIPIQIAFVAVVGLALFFSGSKTLGAFIILTGSFVLDAFSPYRPGIYLLSGVIVLLSANYLIERSFELSNPLILIGMSLFSFVILDLVQVILDPNLIIFGVNLIINTILTLILSLIFTHILTPDRSTLKIGEDVHFR